MCKELDLLKYLFLEELNMYTMPIWWVANLHSMDMLTYWGLCKIVVILQIFVERNIGIFIHDQFILFHSNIGSNNALVPTRRQVIISTSDG